MGVPRKSDMTPKRKAFAYITSGRRLLLLAHPDHPDSGIQVPAGTVRPGESIEDATLREATEETGLMGLDVVAVLGEQTFDMRPFGRDEVHYRTFVHLECREVTPESWEHWERDPEGQPGSQIRFRLFWGALDEPLPELTAGHDAAIPALRRSLDRRSQAPR